MPKYITIVDGHMQSVEAPEPMPLELMQTLVGGNIENVQRHPSPDRPGYTIDVWANDDAYGLPPNVYSVRIEQPIYGTVIIAAATPDGETVGLSDAEMQTVTLHHWWRRAELPVMEIRHREPANA